MTFDPIQELEDMNEKWPNLFKVLQYARGYPVAGIGYEEFMALNEAIISDPAGMENLHKAFMALFAAGPEDRDLYFSWLRDKGLISQEVIWLTEQIEELTKVVLNSAEDPERVEKATASLESLRKHRDQIAGRSTVDFLKASTKIVRLLDPEGTWNPEDPPT